jgi:hypothetical protein
MPPRQFDPSLQLSFDYGHNVCRDFLDYYEILRISHDLAAKADVSHLVDGLGRTAQITSDHRIPC